MTLNIKAGDTYPRLTGVIGVDLTEATVKFILYKADAALNFDLVQNRIATIVGDPKEGNVEFAWRASDTATPGRYFGMFRAIFPDGKVTSWPSKGYLELRITE